MTKPVDHCSVVLLHLRTLCFSEFRWVKHRCDAATHVNTHATAGHRDLIKATEKEQTQTICVHVQESTCTNTRTDGGRGGCVCCYPPPLYIPARLSLPLSPPSLFHWTVTDSMFKQRPSLVSEYNEGWMRTGSWHFYARFVSMNVPAATAKSEAADGCHRNTNNWSL